MSMTDLTKASHQRFSENYYDKHLSFLRDLPASKASAERQRAMYLGMANNAVVEGKLAHADALRQVACGMLPREWASLTEH